MIPGIVGRESPYSFLASIVQTDPQTFRTDSTVLTVQDLTVLLDQVIDFAV